MREGHASIGILAAIAAFDCMSAAAQTTQSAQTSSSISTTQSIHFNWTNIYLVLLSAGIVLVWNWRSYWAAGALTLASLVFPIWMLNGSQLSIVKIPIGLLLVPTVYGFILFGVAAWRRKASRS